MGSTGLLHGHITLGDLCDFEVSRLLVLLQDPCSVQVIGSDDLVLFRVVVVKGAKVSVDDLSG